MKTRVDRGELRKNHEFQKICYLHGYSIDNAAVYTSFENRGVEVSHQALGQLLHSLLKGASLLLKHQPYTFRHISMIERLIVPITKSISPEDAMSGRCPTLLSQLVQQKQSLADILMRNGYAFLVIEHGSAKQDSGYTN